MSLQDNLFIEKVKEDIQNFLKREKRKRQPQTNADSSQENINFTEKTLYIMGIENQCTSTTLPDYSIHKTRNVRPSSAVEIYRPPAARQVKLVKSIKGSSPIKNSVSETYIKTNRSKRPDRAVYVPRYRRSTLNIDSNSVEENILKTQSKELKKISPTVISTTFEKAADQVNKKQSSSINILKNEMKSKLTFENIFSSMDKLSTKKDQEKGGKFKEKCIYQRNCNILNKATNNYTSSISKNSITPLSKPEGYESNVFFDSENVALKLNLVSNPLKLKNKSVNNKIVKQTLISEVLIISSSNDEMEIKNTEPLVPVITVTPLEKKVKKVERFKSKPALLPIPASKFNRDECDWDSLFDDNGDCLDPSLIEELTSSVGEVVIEKPKCSYKTNSRSIEISSDEFAHVLEIYNFPSEFKSSDLAAIFSPFKNGGFELKWVDDTHCLGVFSSPVVAAEVLASNHPFVKTRPLCEATALSKTKVRRNSEFLQPYRSRPETCAALARRLVTKSLGVTLATAKQEREQEKIVLREAKEKKRLANKQREDVWEGIITEKSAS